MTTAESIADAPPGYLELLSENRDFRLLWLGTVVSFLGDWLTTVAVLTIVSELSDSALLIAAVLIAKTLPIFLASPIAGPMADRYDRRLLMIGADVGRAVLVLGMMMAYAFESVPLLLGILTIRTLVAGVFIPARTAAVPDLARGKALPVAVALMGGTWSVMLALGAALGGVLTEFVGVYGALGCDALTFLVSAGFLWGLPRLLPRDEDSEGGTTFLDGLRTLRGRIYLPALLLLKPALSLSGGILVLLPVYAGGRFAVKGPLFLGFLYTCRGLGALVGSMVVRIFVGDAPETLRRAIVPSFVVLALMYGSMGFAPSLYVSGGFLALATIGAGVVWTFSGTLAQRATHREVRGRLFAIEFGLTMLVSSCSSLFTGALLDSGVDVTWMTVGLAAIFLIPAVGWTLVLATATDTEDAP